ncbi:MAG: energy transducer TonB [Thiolinea sp.]
MRLNQLTGLAVSTALHASLAMLLLPLLGANEPKPEEPEPILLELSTFEPPPPPPVILPEPESPIRTSPEPVVEQLAAATPVEPAKEKKPEPLLPKKEKRIEPPPKPVIKPEPAPIIEQPLPKPDPKILQQQAQEHQRLTELREQRQREFVARQQQAEERERLEQQHAHEQAQRRAKWEQAQQREAALQRQAQAKAATKLEQQRAKAAQVTSTKQVAAVTQANSNTSNDLPVISTPRYRSPPSPPDYPQRALEDGIEGTVLIRVTISADGSIMAARVHQSSGNSSLDAAALKAVRSWSFMPAQRDGKSIPSIVQLPVRFNLTS